MIGKAIAALAFAGALAIASIPSDAFAQRGGGFRGGGGFHGGGGFRGGFGGGGFGGGFRGGVAGFRGGFGGGPRFVYGGGPRFYGGGFRYRPFYGYRRPFFVHRRPFVRFGFAAPLYVGYPRCYRLVRVATPWGWGWRRIWVCGPRYRSVYYY